MSDHVQNLVSRARKLSASAWVVFGLVLGHLPLTAVYFSHLGAFGHYLFWPFALAAVVYFGWQRIDWTKFCLSIPGWILLALDAVFVLGSALLGSPWLSVTGLLVLMTAIAVSASDKRTGRAPFELPLLLATVLRPPADADLTLIQNMQLLTTRLSGEILDRIGVLHVRSGNLIELRGKQLFVEEACSGIQSLFTLLFLAAFIAARKRRPILHTVLLLLAAPICAIPMNIGRVTVIALFWDGFQIDLSAGLGHDLLGYVLLVAAAAFLWSADQFCHFFSLKIDQSWATDRSRPYDNPFARTWNWFWRQIPAVRSMRIGASRHVMVATLACAAVLGALQCTTLFAAKSERAAIQPNNFESLQMPKSIDGLELAGFNTEQRSRASSFGAFSARWKYTDGATEYQISFDYPFSSWHKLETCYEGLGWQVSDGEIRGDEWPVAQFDMTQPTGELAYLEYGFVDSRGTIVRPPQAGDPGAAILNRLRKSGLPGTEQELYQTQVVVFSTLPLTDSQVQRASKLHVAARRLLKARFSTPEGQ